MCVCVCERVCLQREMGWRGQQLWEARAPLYGLNTLGVFCERRALFPRAEELAHV